jgi:UDP-glucose 4-epimerase
MSKVLHATIERAGEVRESSMKILVTGANGFVGRTLCRALYSSHTVYGVDNLRFGALRFTPEEASRFVFRQADIREAGQVRAVLQEARPDAIIHLAAIHFIPECERDPELAISTNVMGTVGLLAQCPPGCRFVFASSAAVYRPDEQPLVEDRSPLGPIDVYGLTKAHGEQYVRSLARKRGFPAVIVRLFNVVGPGETNPHVVPQIVAQLQAGRSTLKLGSMLPRRDFIHVADAASGFAAAATCGEVSSGDAVTVNLGTGKAHSVSDVVDLLAEISARRITVELDESRLRAVDNPFVASDTSRMRAVFGWTPRYDLRAALEDTWHDPDLAAYLLEKTRE